MLLVFELGYIEEKDVNDIDEQGDEGYLSLNLGLSEDDLVGAVPAIAEDYNTEEDVKTEDDFVVVGKICL